MGVYQHHDAISGTAMQHVANNYVEKLSKAMSKNNEVYKIILKEKIQQDTNISVSNLLNCKDGINNDTIISCPIFDL